MTAEHRILRLIDAGIIHERDIEQLVGVSRATSMKLSRMHKDGLVAPTRPRGEYLVLTCQGVDRLNELDGVIG